MRRFPPEALGDVLQGIADGLGKVAILGDRGAGFKGRRDGPETRSEGHGADITT